MISFETPYGFQHLFGSFVYFSKYGMAHGGFPAMISFVTPYGFEGLSEIRYIPRMCPGRDQNFSKYGMPHGGSLEVAF